MKLRHDPYQVFRSSKSPAGLYARQKWLDEAGTKLWEVDFEKKVSALLEGQLPNGSWNGSKISTIKHLFALHLTLRDPDPSTDAALDWLLDRLQREPLPGKNKAGNWPPATEIKSLPFVSGPPGRMTFGATLFLATIFGRQRDPQVLAAYQWMVLEAFTVPHVWSTPAVTHNLFRALVVHPEFSSGDAVMSAVEQLARLQTAAGDWHPHLPFYQTINALAHLDLPRADKQLDRALGLLLSRQKRDGTWSRSEPEWNTFLAVHALRNKGWL